MNFTGMAGQLERWYRANKRDLPWRTTARNPNLQAYRALVAEFMLQQTQVNRVIDRYRQFTRTYPSIRALAAADEHDVLTLWQGLGYYSRARNLLACARVVVNEFGGIIPRCPEILVKLPGVGRYTAGAISSIAFNQPEPIVDGNVARVLSRILLIEEPSSSTTAQRQLWETARKLVDRAASPADLNQGLMELGSLVCTPAGPKCDICPVRRHCRARSADRVSEIPVTGTSGASGQQTIHLAALVMARPDTGRIFLRQRSGSAGLWAGLWEPPAIEYNAATATDTSLAEHLCRHVSEQHNLLADTIEYAGSCVRKLSHRTVHFKVMTAGRIRGRAGKGRWVELGHDLERIPMSNAHRRVITIAIERLKKHDATCPITPGK